MPGRSNISRQRQGDTAYAYQVAPANQRTGRNSKQLRSKKHTQQLARYHPVGYSTSTSPKDTVHLSSSI